MVPTPDRPSATDLDAAVELLRALASGVRMSIVIELLDGPLFVNELVSRLDAPQPLVSQHLRILRASGVVKSQRQERSVAYALIDEHLAHRARRRHPRARAPLTGPSAA
ncbi:MAG: metalloregulator ArsR/SmtB family transcription factor [Nakamurella sp.]